MNEKGRIFIACFVIFAVLTLGATSLLAQFETEVKKTRAKVRDIAVKKTSGPPRQNRSKTVQKLDNTRIVTKVDKVKVSSLSITTEKGANVLLESKGPKPTVTNVVADSKGNVVFEDIKPGVYRLVATKDDFATVEADSVTIAPQKAHVLDMGLKQMTYELKIQTNLTGGAVQFSQLKTVAAGGKAQTELSGNYCVVAIQPNGQAVITDLKKGEYDVDIIPPSLEFAKKEASITIPDDLDEDEYEFKIEKDISREEFTTAWIPSEWKVPSAWRLSNGMKVRSEGLGLPSNPRFRQYVDFELISNLKLNDKGSIGIALRAKDERNFYLLVISAERGLDPNTVTLRAVKDGVLQPETLDAAPAGHFGKSLNSVKGFELKVIGDSTGFTVFITDAETGKGGPVGQLKDQYKLYPKGAVGLAGVQKADFDASFFRVCPSRCK